MPISRVAHCSRPQFLDERPRSANLTTDIEQRPAPLDREKPATLLHSARSPSVAGAARRTCRAAILLHGMQQIEPSYRATSTATPHKAVGAYTRRDDRSRND